MCLFRPLTCCVLPLLVNQVYHTDDASHAVENSAEKLKPTDRLALVILCDVSGEKDYPIQGKQESRQAFHGGPFRPGRVEGYQKEEGCVVCGGIS